MLKKIALSGFALVALAACGDSNPADELGLRPLAWPTAASLTKNLSASNVKSVGDMQAKSLNRAPQVAAGQKPKELNNVGKNNNIGFAANMMMAVPTAAATQLPAGCEVSPEEMQLVDADKDFIPDNFQAQVKCEMEQEGANVRFQVEADIKDKDTTKAAGGHRIAINNLGFSAEKDDNRVLFGTNVLVDTTAKSALNFDNEIQLSVAADVKANDPQKGEMKLRGGFEQYFKWNVAFDAAPTETALAGKISTLQGFSGLHIEEPQAFDMVLEVKSNLLAFNSTKCAAGGVESGQMSLFDGVNTATIVWSNCQATYTFNGKAISTEEPGSRRNEFGLSTILSAF